MEHTLLCLLLLLSTHIYSGHSEDDNGQAKAVLTIQPKSSQIFSGESVTLRCNIQRGEVTDWKYTWRRDGVDFLSREHEYEISEVKTSDNGDYRCLGTHIDQKMDSKWSDAVSLTVTALPTASVKIVSTQDPLYSGDTVKLQCELSNYTDWTYHWLINKECLSSQTSKTTTISLSDQAGQYQCQGTRTRRPQNSYLSSSLHIIVTALPKTTLTVNPNPAYTGETVTLTCSVGSASGWRYTWYKDNTKKVVTLSGRHTTTGATFTISRAAESDQGLYWCQGEIQSRSISSIISDPVNIIVKDKPQAVLSVSPQWLNPGDSVTLSCGVKESSTGWRFFWYRTVPYTAGLLSLSDRSYSVEPLSGNGTTEDSYTLIPAGPSHTGGYVCRAGRGDPVYDTLYSEPQFLWSGEPKPSVSLKIIPNRTQHFTSKSLSLSCEEKRNSTGWRLKRYREKAVESECGSNWGSIAGSTCTIRSTRKKDSGVYWCESGSGEYSNAVNITVDGSIVSISVLPRLLCGLLVASPFLLVSIMLMVKCCWARGLCSSAKSPQYELGSDDVIEQTESSVRSLQ